MVKKIKLEVSVVLERSVFLYLSLSFLLSPLSWPIYYSYVKALFPSCWLFYFSGRGLIIEPKSMREAKIYSFYLDPFLKIEDIKK